jgi:hypothetical protein
MKRPALAAVSMACITLAGLTGTTPCVAQSIFPAATPDTAVALTRDMKILDERLSGLTRIPLERWGNTFYARAMYVEDVAGPARASEIGLSTSIDAKEPGVLRDSLRSTMRMRQQYTQGANILRRNVRFVMKHERTYADEGAWIVVTFDLTVAQLGEKNRSQKAWTYAHSEKGILNAPAGSAGR